MEIMTKSPNSNKKCINFIKSMDMYGHPIILTYKNSSTFKSFIGGILTILTRLAILVYFVAQIVSVIQKQCTITVLDNYIDTGNDNTSYYLNDS